MSTTRSAPRPVMTASFTIVLMIALVLWAATVANAVTIKSSDAAGNALSQAFGALMGIALFVLLTILLVLAAVRGDMPMWMRVAALVLVPASGAATVAAVEILGQGTEWPVRWPLVIPVVAPALLIAFALWAYVPSLRGMASATATGAVVFSALALVSVAPWPLFLERGRLRTAGPGELQAFRSAKRAKWSASERDTHRAGFDTIEPDSPLYAWLFYTEPGDPMRERAFAAINRLPERQREVEEMVLSGNIAAIREIPNLNVEPTPSLCDAARESIVFKARRARPRLGHPSYTPYARDVEFYMPTVEWLVKRGCPLTDALTELEATANTYADSPERARFLAKLNSLRSAG
jgi:hypothetical protein